MGQQLPVSSNSKSEAFLESQYLPTLILDNQDTFTACNPAAADLFGFACRSEVMSLTPDQLSPCVQPCGMRSASKAKKMLEVARQRGQNCFSWRHSDKYNKHFDAFVILQSFQLAHGVLTLAYVLPSSSSSPTPLLNLATKHVLHDISDGIMLVNQQRKIVEVNHAFEQLTGYRKDDVIGQHAGFMKSGLHDDTFYSEMWRTITEDGFWQGEILDKMRNGEVRSTLLKIRSVDIPTNDGPYYLGFFSDTTERRQSRRAIERLAYYDALTHLPNRRLLFMGLEQRIKKNSGAFAVACFDVDKFKQVNDFYGHLYGDNLLTNIAACIKSKLNNADFVARISGDEFITVFRDSATLTEVQLAVSGLLNYVRDRFSHVTLSCGIALYPCDGEDVKSLRTSADIALYYAKSNGGNRATLFEPEMGNQFRQKLMREKIIKNIIKRNEPFLHYQPIICLKTNKCVGVEALVRINALKSAAISPQELIRIAEEQALINELSEHLFSLGFDLLHRHHQLSSMSFNVSGDHLLLEGFTDTLRFLLRHHQIDSRRITIEITESCLIQDVERSTAIIDELQTLGFRVAIDDFGTGYSSLSYLKNLNVDVLKIDRSFISSISNPTTRNRLITEHIIQLAHKLDMQVVAEGVETEHQLLHLQALGCDQVQGYYFSAAVSEQELFSVINKINHSIQQELSNGQ